MESVNKEYFDAFDIGDQHTFGHGHEDIDSSLNYLIISCVRYDNEGKNPVDISSHITQLGQVMLFSTIWNIGEVKQVGVFRIRTIIKTPDSKTVLELNSIITIN